MLLMLWNVVDDYSFGSSQMLLDNARGVLLHHCQFQNVNCGLDV